MVPLWSNCSVLSRMILGHFWCDPLSQIIRGETVVHSLIDKESSLQMRPPSQIIRGETVVHSLINKESLQMRPPSQIIWGETVVHALINKESLQMRPPSQIIWGKTVVHSLIDEESLQMGPPSQIIWGETVVHSLIDEVSLQMHTSSQIMRENFLKGDKATHLSEWFNVWSQYSGSGVTLPDMATTIAVSTNVTSLSALSESTSCGWTLTQRTALVASLVDFSRCSIVWCLLWHVGQVYLEGQCV